MASSRGLLLQGGAMVITNHLFKSHISLSQVVCLPKFKNLIRNCSTTTSGSILQPPDVPRLAETARISLTPTEVEEVTPKILQVIDWFGQLQDVELQSVEPALRADMEGDKFREDIPETFENREALISSVPSYDDPFIKVPKVLNKE